MRHVLLYFHPDDVFNEPGQCCPVCKSGFPLHRFGHAVAKLGDLETRLNVCIITVSSQPQPSAPLLPEPACRSDASPALTRKNEPFLSALVLTPALLSSSGRQRVHATPAGHRVTRKRRPRRRTSIDLEPSANVCLFFFFPTKALIDKKQNRQSQDGTRGRVCSAATKVIPEILPRLCYLLLQKHPHVWIH